MDIKDTTEGTLPLGLCKQATMKLDSFMTDVREIAEEDDLSPENKLMFNQMSELAGTMMAAIINVVSQEMDEESFIAETMDMDPIDPYPDPIVDPMDEEV